MVAVRETIRVAVPVKVARLRVWVDKGRHWSAVDRLYLWALSQSPRAASELAELSNIPTRIVSEVIVRMMRFGWVELATTASGVAFRATKSGRQVLDAFEVLPPVTQPMARRVSFVIEPFESTPIALKELRPYRARDIATVKQKYDVRELVLEQRAKPGSYDLHVAAEQMIFDDERLTRIDFKASAIIDQFALFTVVGNKLKYPAGVLPRALETAITDAAAERSPGARIFVPAIPAPPPEIEIEPSRAFSLDDIILSGADHLQAFKDVLRRAGSRVFMHSTFVNEANFIKLLPEFRKAARRGVHVDIFWGAKDPDNKESGNLEEAIKISTKLQADRYLRGRIRIHLYSTRSHAKLIIADAASEGSDDYLAIVGSCNWLSTGFSRVEASIVVRNARVIGRLARELSIMISEGGTSGDAVGDLAAISRALLGREVEEGPATIEVVAGNRHGELMRRAREEANDSIVVGGDRLGLAAEARTIIPMMVAAERKVDSVICYSRPSGPVSRRNAAELKEIAAAGAVRMVEIPKRELHGKFLIWDDDDVVITSLNWSSADTNRSYPQGEIGVHVASSGLAALLRQRLLNDWPTLGPPTSGPGDVSEVGKPTTKKRPRRRRKKRPVSPPSPRLA